MSSPYERDYVVSHRPGVVTVALVILWIQIALQIVGGCFLFTLSTGADGGTTRSIITFVALFFIVYAVIMAILTANLAGGKDWARYAVIILTVLGIAGSLYTLFDSVSTFGTLIGIGLSVVIVFCLANSQAKEWCLERTRGG